MLEERPKQADNDESDEPADTSHPDWTDYIVLKDLPPVEIPPEVPMGYWGNI